VRAADPRDRLIDMRLSMVMITKNERENIAPCFDTFWPYVDEVVLCDTGSRDGTVAEARRYAKAQGEPGKLIVGHFKWCDDFGAARTHAHSLASGDVHAYVDLDDRIVGGEHLPALAERFAANPKLVCIDILYSGPSRPENGNATPHDLLGGFVPRMFRAPVRWAHLTWEGVVLADGEIQRAREVWWWHASTRPLKRRDRDIAERWVERDPTNAQAVYAFASEILRFGHAKLASSLMETVAASRPELEPKARAWWFMTASNFRGEVIRHR
jgi:glycosyltransferase involved in cell wall biosynthesis